jgi:hypothetical protein
MDKNIQKAWYILSLNKKDFIKKSYLFCISVLQLPYNLYAAISSYLNASFPRIS